MSESLDAIRSLQRSMDAAVIGQSAVVEKIIISLLCNGNVLLEGLPGTAKTRAIKTLGELLNAAFSIAPIVRRTETMHLLADAMTPE